MEDGARGVEEGKRPRDPVVGELEVRVGAEGFAGVVELLAARHDALTTYSRCMT